MNLNVMFFTKLMEYFILEYKKGGLVYDVECNTESITF